MAKTDGFVDWWKTYTDHPNRADLRLNVQAETAALDAWEAATQERASDAVRPLTLAQIWDNDEIMAANTGVMSDLLNIVQAVESAHGIHETRPENLRLQHENESMLKFINQKEVGA